MALSDCPKCSSTDIASKTESKEDVLNISGTKEWASSNANFMFGCQNNCRYCYAKAMCVRHKKIAIENWATPIIDAKRITKHFGKRNGTIMFPTTHDIYPQSLNDTLVFLEKLLSPGNNVLIVSKPYLECIKAICDKFQHYKSNILFRFTIGSSSDTVLKFWEPNATCFAERLESLKYAFKAGYKTSISCEPMLDNNIAEVVEKVRNYVTDAIWLGKMNQPVFRLNINGYHDYETMQKANELIAWQSEVNIKILYHHFKNDPKIKWKESIKEVVGLNRPNEKGLDI